MQCAIQIYSRFSKDSLMATVRTILTSIDDADFDRVYDSREKLVDVANATFPFDEITGPTSQLDVPANQKAHIEICA